MTSEENWFHRNQLEPVPRLGAIAGFQIGEVFFIHPNRVGGSSIEEALGLYHHHGLAREVIELVGRKRWDAAFTFSMVRNPWDRVASLYRRRVRRQGIKAFQAKATGLDPSLVTFPAWVRKCWVERDPSYYDEPRMFMPQVDWLKDEEGLINLDFIGRYERLEFHFWEICSYLGKVGTPLPHVRSTGGGDYREMYDDEAAELVAQHFQKDIETFHYEF